MALTLNELGITNEELVGRAVNVIADRVLESEVTAYDEDGQPDDYMTSTRLGRLLKQACRDRIDEQVRAVTEKHVMPVIVTRIEEMVLQKTTSWGEKKGEPQTFIEYVIGMARAYMTETVDTNGRSKKSGGSYWSGEDTRICHAVHQYLHDHVEKAMKQVLSDGMKILTDGITETAKIKLAEISATLKVNTEIKN